MRVKDAASVERVGKVGPRDTPETDPALRTAEAPTDKVSMEQSQEHRSMAAEVRRQAGQVRQERLAELEAAVKNGTYKPNARAITERIIAAAALDAQLATIARGK